MTLILNSSDVEDDGDKIDSVDNDGWDHWGANDNDFHHIPFRGTAAYKPPQTGQKPDSPFLFFLLFFSQTLFQEIATETNRHKRSLEKNCEGSRGFQKPVAVIDYTSKMGGVDRADHYCSSYGFLKKSLKWWRKLYFWILEISLVNSFHLYNLNQNSKNLPALSHLEFRKKIIEGLVGNVRNKMSRKRGRPSTGDTEDRLNGKLHLIRAHERKVTKDCAVCSNRKVKGGRKETSFYCDTCERKPGLHPNKCFALYHTEKKYR
ncbi:hypothetical protein ANN_10672 [Periplaneta americana]|uniref:PiggyBac transposable element-derived protein domain-containing protein n=1 Tax=Periplaneta americana TaxID=6978 RepID=A0ABQ8T439_PERAM|nr:hypothetical protein ANN_10672 [Periplaneta americana]